MTLRAQWCLSRGLRLEDRLGEIEIARALCNCGAVLGFKWVEDAAYYAKDASPKLRAFRDAFRLFPGMVRIEREDVVWQLSPDAQQQRRQAIDGDQPLSEWRPTPANPQSREEHEWFVERVNRGAVRGVLAVAGWGAADELPVYIVDPHAISVTIRCPDCSSLNDVPPCDLGDDLEECS